MFRVGKCGDLALKWEINSKKQGGVVQNILFND